MGRGSGKKKASSSSSNQRKPPAKGADPFSGVYGGNPYEPGTKNYQALLNMRREIIENGIYCGIHVDDPLWPDNPCCREFLPAFVTAKNSFKDYQPRETKGASPSKDDPKSRESEVPELLMDDGGLAAACCFKSLEKAYGPAGAAAVIESKIARCRAKKDRKAAPTLHVGSHDA